MAGKRKALVVGSGAGGSTAAMVLAEAGYDVVVFEKGDKWFDDLTKAAPTSRFSSDELKAERAFAKPDPVAEPRTYRWHSSDTEPRTVGAIQDLPQTVGGGTVHWDAKTPRFWDIDFRKLSLLGPQSGADVVDWPFSYEEISPVYDEVESLIGVAGDIGQIAAHPTLAHAPRSKALPMPAGPPQLASLVASEGCLKLEPTLHPFAAPMAINSVERDGRPACNNCGQCSNHGCPILARVGALAPLRRAVQAGAEVRERSMVVKVNWSGTKATGVTWMDDQGKQHTESGDLVVLACLAIETARLAKLSDLPDPNQTVGTHFMQHWFTDGTGIFLDKRLHGHRGRSTTHVADDFADPDFPGARDAARRAGIPYFRGGTMEIGGTQFPLGEANTYRFLLGLLRPNKPFGTDFKELMRSSVLRDRMCGIQMIGEDLPYRDNAVDLDPKVKDFRGLPVARITYSPKTHELAAQNFYLPYVAEILRRAGAAYVTAVPDSTSDFTPLAGNSVPTTEHIMGGMRMGSDQAISATDTEGRYHHLDNLFVADGSVFPSSGGHNPTLTIMATALRNARRWVK
jgi:choline dehydrogenase-like flavoprotein